MSLQVGQIIFLKPLSNAARRSTEIKEVKIKKIGRRYFEVEESYYGRFSLTTLKHDGGQYMSDWQAYITRQEIEDEREIGLLKDEIVNKIDHSKIPLNTLRQISQLINQ